MTSLINANNISVIRQTKHILKDVSINIADRDFITIIGPNGAGKSMLLKCLMGLYQPEKGSVTKRKNLKIGYIPQRMASNNSMPITVHGFLRLRKKNNENSLQNTVDEIGIEKILNKPLSVLSTDLYFTDSLKVFK